MISNKISALIGLLIFMSSHLHGKLSLPHSHKEMDFNHSLYQVAKPREADYLKVSEIHSIFYAAYGNPKGIPVVILHGGPGIGCDDSLSRFFDLDRWNVIMFDQRGAMRSQPFCCMEENSTQHSIEDIESLRKHLGIEKWVVFGGSWGSTLAMLYGQEHPDRCKGFILRGIFLAREQDSLHLFYGMGKVFPEAYEPFLNFIPLEERDDLISAYYKRFTDPNPEIRKTAAYLLLQYVFTCSTHLPNPALMEKLLQNDRLILSTATSFFHYLRNQFFIEPNQILSRMEKIAHLTGYSNSWPLGCCRSARNGIFTLSAVGQ